MPWCAGEAMPGRGKLDRLISRAGKVTGAELNSVVAMAERRTLAKTLSILDDASHPLHTALYSRRSEFSNRFKSVPCTTDRYKNSFIPRAIRVYNELRGGRGFAG